MSEEVYHLLTQAINIKVNSRGKAIGMLNAGTKPRQRFKKPE